ncbi:MAG: ribulokinase [Fulvivirga sp.]
MNKNLCIGIDYGTDSVRAVLINAADGAIIGSKVHWYKRWKEGLYCNSGANQFRQHPLDHIEGLEASVSAVVKESGIDPADVKGICIDTTGSSPMPVDKNGTPVALLPGFEENPNAMMVLWKDHTAIEEANEINTLAKTWGGEDFTKFSGGIYSSEWFWAKILHVSREDAKVREATWSWLEHCDYLTYLLTNNNDLETLKRSRCAAGHKAMWHESWGGLPEDEFLAKLDPYLVKVKKNASHKTYTSDQVAGKLNREWAERLGLSEDVVVAVGTIDAHAGAVGAEVEEFTLVRVMGTSTCDIIVSGNEVLKKRTVKGICGQVDGSVIPGLTGLEAGQSAFGDVLAWYRDILAWPIENLLGKSTLLNEDQKMELAQEMNGNIIRELSFQAEQIPANESIPVALDWVNGRRTPDANQSLKAAIVNLSLGTKAPHIFRALVEAIAFGSKSIVDRFIAEGVEIKSVVGIGGVAKKSSFVMQTLANVLNMPIKVAASEQTGALGAAMYAAVAAGIHLTMKESQQTMGSGFEATYRPQEEMVSLYQDRYEQYMMLGEFEEKRVGISLSK